MKDGRISMPSESGNSLDIECEIAKDQLSHGCDVCKSFIPGLAVIEMSPREWSYATDLLGTSIVVCEPCVMTIFKALKQSRQAT